MTDITDKAVLMKCERCGYQEMAPIRDLELLRSVEEDLTDYEDHLLCPFCLSDMYRADSPRFNKNNDKQYHLKYYILIFSMPKTSCFLIGYTMFYYGDSLKFLI